MSNVAEIDKNGLQGTPVAYAQLQTTTITGQITIAAPGVATLAGHGLVTGQAVQLAGAGLPTGLVAGTTYYVIVLSSSTFAFATTPANAAAGVGITTTGTSTGAQTFQPISLAVPAGARQAYICAEAQAIRWRDDGVVPTTAIGMNLASGTCMLYSGPLSAFQFVPAAGGGILNVAYYR